MKRPIGHRTSTAKDLGTILENQSSPAYMAAVARQRAAIEAGHVWHYFPSIGQWRLVPVVDGTVQQSEQAA